MKNGLMCIVSNLILFVLGGGSILVTKNEDIRQVVTAIFCCSIFIIAAIYNKQSEEK